MKIILLSLPDQYNGEQLYGKKKVGVGGKKLFLTATHEKSCDEGGPLVWTTTGILLI